MSSRLDIYLAQLAVELRARGLAAARIVEEARGHLTDATEDGLQRGLTREEAEHDAIARFGAPDLVASTFAPTPYRVLNRLMRAFGFGGAFSGVLAPRLFTVKPRHASALLVVDKPRRGYRIPHLTEPEPRAPRLPLLARFPPAVPRASGA